MHSALGMTRGARIRAAGEMIDHGAVNSVVKNTAPERRMTRRTSERTSIVFSRKTLSALRSLEPRIRIADSQTLCQLPISPILSRVDRAQHNSGWEEEGNEGRNIGAQG